MSLASLREDDGLAMAGTDYQLAICDEIAAQLEAKSERVFTIYNPIVRQSFTFARPEIDEPAQFLYLGRLTYQGQKNLQELLHGVAKLSFPYVLHMVGKGRDETDEVQLRALAESLGIAENIRWHGWQAQAWQYVREQIPKLSAIVLSSRAEGMPMVLAEAMSYGVACVSNDCPTGPKSLIQEGENGWLYPCGKIATLSEKLRCAAQTALSPAKIKASVEHFYEDTYQKNLLQIFAQSGVAKS